MFFSQLKNLLESIKGVVFDCDGVMFDSREVNKRYYNFIRTSLGFGPMSKAELDFVFMHNVHTSLQHILPEQSLQQAHELRKRVSYKDFIQYMIPEPGLYSLLSFLRNKNIRCAVNTNRTDTMEMVLELFDLKSYFFPVITAGKVCFSKPHPESMFKIMDMWNLKARHLLYIGDSEVDQITAQRSNVPFAAYKNLSLMADIHIKNFYNFRDILKNTWS